MTRKASTYSKFVAVSLLIVVIGLLLARDRPSCTTGYKKDAVIKISGQKSLTAELASTEIDRERGLSGRACIPAQSAMLFAFDAPGYYGIWMKDMKFPIDIIWLDSNKKVTHIETAVSPDTYPSIFTPRDLSRYVIEMHDGTSTELGLVVGSQLNW